MKRASPRTLWVACWCCAIGLYLAAPATAGSLEEAARQEYAAGRYAAAATAFAAAAGTDPGLADVAWCLDAATASRLADDPGRAAWWLYRARRIAPGNTVVAAALTAAGLPVTAADLPVVPWLSPGTLWWLALVANAGFWAGLAGLRLFRVRVSPWAIRVAGAVVTGLWLGIGWTALAPVFFPKAVVLRVTQAASAPETAAQTLFPLAPGTVVSVGAAREGWRRVVTEPPGERRAGWVAHDALATFPP